MATSSTGTKSLSELKNVLAASKSPYLLQHKDNPVAWQEFTPATIALAKQLDKPIFLSSGYSACHWCHVLAHESFEDSDVAEMMNKWFVNVKVDREERPDVDRVYMTYLQATSGGGGWPMSIFMTPDLEPFFAGTYFPKMRFKSLLARIAELWEDDREQCTEMGRGAIEQLKEMSGIPGTLDQIIATSPASGIYTQLLRQHDPRYGGFSQGGPRSSGPKFPSCSMTLEPLARLASYASSSFEGGAAIDREKAREVAVKMLRGIWKGGIHDWVGGGVARYSVDEKWIVPHFEKMLYDQAQLVTGALDFALISNPAEAEDESHRKVLEEDRALCFDLAADILEYTLRVLKHPRAGFWSAEDADSAPEEGAKKSEGAYYIWDKSELDDILGDEADLVNHFFGVKQSGNVDPKHDAHGEMTGKNILYQAHTYGDVGSRFNKSEVDVKIIVSRACDRIRERRDTREPPGMDDKILTAWNGLMISALAQGAMALPDSYAVKAMLLPDAEEAVELIKTKLWDPETRQLARSYREGKGPIGQTDDYAFLIRGLLDLYEATGKEDHALWAIELQERQDELFWDEQGGGYFASAPDEHVLIRMKDAQDAAEPSATSVSVHNLSRLSLLASNQYDAYEKRAEEIYLSVGEELKQFPRAFGYTACGLMDIERGYREVIVIGPPSDPTTQGFLSLARSIYAPYQIVIHIDPSNPPRKLAEKNDVLRSLIEGSDANQQKTTEASLRVCEGGVCGLPVTSIEEAKKILEIDAEK
ncbi:cold-induced thioredoxin domain-containing protein [Kwoniella heveanensis BCC8398]|uniref:Cold-induced thioredoxin domain-containing protein n=1 Tax=Kwoniella heveanensis BCC8398 TaxID=1296120 RepID=A0A1B9GSZ7_9TREE|nr:cold-induced thioredoxin domain-containing protein [Kwoniella heveanensis BCC8398]